MGSRCHTIDRQVVGACGQTGVIADAVDAAVGPAVATTVPEEL